MSREELRLTIAMLKESLAERDSTILSLERRVEHLKWQVDQRDNDIDAITEALKECKASSRETANDVYRRTGDYGASGL